MAFPPGAFPGHWDKGCTPRQRKDTHPPVSPRQHLPFLLPSPHTGLGRCRAAPGRGAMLRTPIPGRPAPLPPLHPLLPGPPAPHCCRQLGRSPSRRGGRRRQGQMVPSETHLLGFHLGSQLALFHPPACYAPTPSARSQLGGGNKKHPQPTKAQRRCPPPPPPQLRRRV